MPTIALDFPETETETEPMDAVVDAAVDAIADQHELDVDEITAHVGYEEHAGDWEPGDPCPQCDTQKYDVVRVDLYQYTGTSRGERSIEDTRLDHGLGELEFTCRDCNLTLRSECMADLLET